MNRRAQGVHFRRSSAPCGLAFERSVRTAFDPGERRSIQPRSEPSIMWPPRVRTIWSENRSVNHDSACTANHQVLVLVNSLQTHIDRGIPRGKRRCICLRSEECVISFVAIFLFCL
jgi:hypothetical protein